MPSDDLAAFLLARIAEDEVLARAANPGEWITGRTGTEFGTWVEHSHVCSKNPPRMIADATDGYRDSYDAANMQHIARWSPARVLAECEAKRRAIAWICEVAARIDGEWGCSHDADAIRAGRCGADGGEVASDGLALLGLPYADHPDYREEWRP